MSSFTRSEPKAATAAVTAVAALAASYGAFRASRYATAKSLPSSFSKVLENESGKGESDLGGKPRGNIAVDGFDIDLICYKILPFYPGLATTWASFTSVAQKNRDRPCHGTLDASTKQWSWYVSSRFDCMASIEANLRHLSVLRQWIQSVTEAQPGD